MSKRQQLKVVVKHLVDTIARSQGAVIKDLEFDGDAITFTLFAPDVDNYCTLNIPENWPRGSFELFDNEGVQELGRGSLPEIFNRLVGNFARLHNVRPIPQFQELAAAADEVEPLPLARQVSTLSVGDDELFIAGPIASENAAPLREAIAHLQTKFGRQCVGVMVTGNADHILRFRFSTEFIDDETAKVWGMTPGIPVIIEISFAAPYFLKSSRRPDFDVYQCDVKDVSVNLTSDKLQFQLQWQLRQRITEHLVWPIPSDKVKPTFEKFYETMYDRLKNCTKYCIICDNELGYVGLKPAVCDRQLCVFSHSQYGLGEDVGLFIQNNPEVTDLLICLCCAAAQGEVRRFNPFPNGIEVRVSADGGPPRGKPDDKSLSFVDGEQRNGAFVNEILQKIPSVKELAKYTTTQELRDFLDAKHPLCFALLRWVITSNRTHLELLPKDKQMSEMQTDMQFILRSSTPEKEKVFSEEKREHGNIWAWHGSAFGNWHSIMRMGLRNYSNTELMSNAAAYGAGIYLAKNSGVSLGYTRGAQRGWDNSSLLTGGGTGLALCEIIDRGYKANPYFVIPEENHVNTRFFFLYSGGASVNIEASAVKRPNLGRGGEDENASGKKTKKKEKS